MVRDFALAGVDRVAPDDRDTIGSAADYILQREDIDSVVVFGVVGDRVDGSLRTNSPSVDPGVFLEGAFGVSSDGRPYGGGRADKGAFQLPLGMLAESRVVPDIEREYERMRRLRPAPPSERRAPLRSRAESESTQRPAAR